MVITILPFYIYFLPYRYKAVSCCSGWTVSCLTNWSAINDCRWFGFYFSLLSQMAWIEWAYKNNHLRKCIWGGFHGSAYVSKSKYFSSLLINVIALKTPLRASSVQVQLVVEEWRMTKLLRRFQWILPTLSTVKFSSDPHHLFYGWWFYGYLHIGNSVICLRMKNWACAKNRVQANK